MTADATRNVDLDAVPLGVVAQLGLLRAAAERGRDEPSHG
jgi:hypothetical protein